MSVVSLTHLRTPLLRGSIHSKLKSIATPVLLGLFCFLVYNANLRQIGAGDTLPSRYLPLILWRHGTLELNSSNARLVAHGHASTITKNRPEEAAGKVNYFEPWAYWVARTRGHERASLYPVVTPILVAPLYVPAVLWLNEHGWGQPQVGRVAELMEKISASFLASLACVLMYLVLRRDCGKWSLPLSLVFAFGTNTWMTSSQALWQHGTAELLIALALLLAVGKATPVRTMLLGAVCVLIAANRPPDALVAAAFGVFTIWSQRRGALWLLAGGALPLAVLLYYNLHFVGHIAGAYALGKPPDNFWQPGLSGVAGLLVSPARGLLVFAPFLVFLPLGFMQRLREPSSKVLAIVLGAAVAVQFLFYSQLDWRAGESWGPRWLTDVLPILVWMLAPAVLVLRPIARGAFIVTMVASVAVQTIGAFWYTKASDELIFAGNRASMRGAWNPQNTPFLVELRHAPAGGELQYDARGSLDRVGPVLMAGFTDMPKLESGAVLEGWALTGGRSPAELVLLIDGIAIGATKEFLTRVDVNEAMQTDAPSGWRVYANTRGVAPGKRVLQLAVRVQPRSDIRIVGEQRVLVEAHEASVPLATAPLKPASLEDLDAMAERAAAMLRTRQNEQGYWLTTFTSGLHYESPHPEMNTYLTSMLVDLLAPVASQRGLGEAVDRAKRHLTAQIESNGLVRYHGLPDSPTMGHLGCIITPDSDDTALAWRLSGLGAEDPRLEPMLRVLASYRDKRGLYRTWLAPRNEYKNLDPGRDPNPTDITIQMHVYLMLRKLDPPAAEKLARAIQRSFEDEDVWAYYAKAPLVPYLRCAELRQLGCDVPLPTERLALTVAGQEVWGEAVRNLVKILESPQDANLRQAIRHLLVRIGSDDFAQVRQGPPLLYHNDLTATVRRFYWSEDSGYALWLRLYEATAEKQKPASPRSPSP